MSADHPNPVTWDAVCKGIIDHAAGILTSGETADPDMAVFFAMDEWLGGGIMIADEADILALGIEGVTAENFADLLDSNVLVAARADARLAGFEGRFLDPELLAASDPGLTA